MDEQKLSVAILDDEEHIIRLLEVLIPWKELSLLYLGNARNGIDGKNLILEKKPDIIISDIKMPGLDGLSLIAEIHSVLPDSEFIIISGFSQFDYAKTAIAYGVKNYLLKPVNKEELKSTLLKIIEEKQASKLQKESIKKSEEMNLCFEFERVLNNNIANSEKNFIDVHVFSLCLIKIDSSDRIIPGELENLLQEKFSDLLRRVLSASVFCYKYGRFYFLLKKTDDVEYDLKKLYLNLKDVTQVFPQLTFTIFGSEIRQTVFETAEILQNALPLRRENDKSVFYGDFPLKNDFGATPKIYDEWAKMSLHFFDGTDCTLVNDAVQNLFKNLEKIHRTAWEEIFNFCARQIAIICEEKNHCGLKWYEDVFLKTISLANTGEELKLRFESEVIKFCEEFFALKKKDDLRPIRLANAYMNEHYSDYDISLETVAEKVGLTPSYLSALYKKETGSGFLEALTEVRISKAKELLQETNETFAKITELVGYTDIKYFSKIFKKVTGIKPNEFRQFYS